MHNKQEEFSARAALITMPPEDPAQIARLAKTLCDRNRFGLTILGYKPTSIFSLRFREPVAGLQMTGFAVYQFIKYGHGRTQVHCREILQCLGNESSSDTMPDVNYISGRPSKVAGILDSMFHLLVIPRRFRPPNIRASVVASIDLRFVRARKIPILFCARPEKWHRVIIMDVDRAASCGEIPLIGCLQELFGGLIRQETTKDPSTITLYAEASPKQSSPLLSYDILDASEEPPEEQGASVLVIPTRTACSVLRCSRLRKVIQNWQGSTLILPC